MDHHIHIIDIIKQFGPPKRPVVPKDWYIEVDNIIGILDKISSALNISFYLVDNTSQSFLYVSKNPLFLCGYTPEFVKNSGYKFYEKVVSYEDILFLSQINKAGFDFFYRQDVTDRENLVIEYNFELIHLNRTKNRINHKLFPLVLTEDGNIWLSLCIISLSLHEKNTLARIRNTVTNESYVFSPEKNDWEKVILVNLTKKELLVLQLAAQGCSNKIIAEKLSANLNTIKFHKKNLFNKFGTKNIIETIIKARIQGII
ncbi:MAG: helix-turn-helix transcriptional regulator [Dysgonomonas sp.]|nr:helix-turn-helix transcriptional regulator [Dysgonomonas sp.]